MPSNSCKSSGEIALSFRQPLAVRKCDGAELSVVEQTADFSLDGQHGQKLHYLRRARIERVLHSAVTPLSADEKTNPIQTGPLGFQTIVSGTNDFLHLI
jgi:hypothetical protein